MSLLDGLEQFGLGKLKDVEVYDKEADKEKEEVEKKEEEKVFQEETVLLEKNMKCPVCESPFKSKAVRSGRARRIGTDTDLRPIWQPVDCSKYDAIVCPKCGYAALSRFWKDIQDSQIKMIQENISANFNGIDDSGSFYTYDDAIARHKLALANTVVKKAKASEKAYTCLKLAWLCRGKAESLDASVEENKAKIQEAKKEELELLNNAYAGFCNAFSNEDFPMCGMSMVYVSQILADLARRTGKLDEASRWVSRVLTDRTADDRIKDKARDVKEIINTLKKKTQ